jgi:hypothetical protein
MTSAVAASCDVGWGLAASSAASRLPDEQAEAKRKTHPERHRRAICIALASVWPTPEVKGMLLS